MLNMFRVRVGNDPNWKQKWSSYPDSPVLSSAYPYQFICYVGAPDNKTMLLVSDSSFTGSATRISSATGKTIYAYYLSGSTWVYWFSWTGQNTFSRTAYAANFDIPAITGGTYFGKTTTAAQDAGITRSLIQIA